MAYRLGVQHTETLSPTITISHHHLLSIELRMNSLVSRHKKSSPGITSKTAIFCDLKFHC